VSPQFAAAACQDWFRLLLLLLLLLVLMLLVLLINESVLLLSTSHARCLTLRFSMCLHLMSLPTHLQSCAGLSYSFSVYAPTIKDTLGLTQTQIATVGSAVNLGGYFAIISGSVYDNLKDHHRLGPRCAALLWCEQQQRNMQQQLHQPYGGAACTPASCLGRCRGCLSPCSSCRQHAVMALMQWCPGRCCAGWCCGWAA
jgi:hypothetical protein